MKAMKWIIPGLFLVLGILGLCFFHFGSHGNTGGFRWIAAATF